MPALLDPAPLRRAAAVVRNGGDVLDGGDLETGDLQRTDCGLAAAAGALHPRRDALQTHLGRVACARLRGHLRRERGALAGALEAGLARAAPADHVAVGVRDRDDRVVEARLHVGHAVRAHLAVALLRLLDVCQVKPPVRRLRSPPEPRARVLTLLAGLHLLAADCHPLGTLARASVRLRALPVHRQAAAVPQPPVGADVHEALDVHRLLAAERAFDLVLALDERAQLAGVLVRERLRARVRGDARLLEQALRRRRADAEDVGERDLDALFHREIDACDACHGCLLALALLVPRIAAADHPDDALATHHFAVLADLLDGSSYFHDRPRFDLVLALPTPLDVPCRRDRRCTAFLPCVACSHDLGACRPPPAAASRRDFVCHCVRGLRPRPYL